MHAYVLWFQLLSIILRAAMAHCNYTTSLLKYIAISLLDRATHHIISRNDPENEFGDPGRINSKFSRPIELNNTVESRDPS